MPTTRRREVLQLRSDGDVVRARQAVRSMCVELGFSLVDLTKMVTAASELARNTLIYGGGGTITIESLEDGSRRGVRMTFDYALRPGPAQTANAQRILAMMGIGS